jgi:biotin carboxyl carrier protein
MKLTIDDRTYDIQLTPDGVIVDGELFKTSVDGFGSTRIVTVNGRTIRVDLGAPEDDVTPVIVEGQVLKARLEGRPQVASRPAVARPTPTPTAAARAPSPAPAGPVKGAVTAQMTGRVVRVAVQPGDRVQANDLLLVLEAMKMENEIRAPRAGTVKEVRVSAGDRVNQGDPLVVLDE